jgi:RNA ligase
MFPLIKNIDDVLPYIEGNDNFSINNKDDYIVIDYIINTPDTFRNSVEKECRGIIFDQKTGKLIRRPFHKFFNVNERPETLIENLDFSKPHNIFEKLDGSMISPFYTNNNKIIWGSKAGETFLSPMVEDFVSKNYDYILLFMITFPYITCIFEFCTNKNRIVISHPEDRLVLTGMRITETGEYLPYESLEYYRNIFNIEIVKQYPGNVSSMQELIENVKPMQGLEGFVVAWEDGTRVKIKADEYCIFHKAKEEIFREKNVIGLLVEGKADDFRTLLNPEDRDKLEKFEKKFWSNIEQQTEIFYKEIILVKNMKISRKDYALKYADDLKHNQFLRGFIFKYFDEKTEFLNPQLIKKFIINILSKNTGTQTLIDKCRFLWDIEGSLKWEY